MHRKEGGDFTHPKIPNPQIMEIRKSLEETVSSIDNIEQSFDLITESWIVKFLSNFDDNIKRAFMVKCNAILENLQLEDPKNLKTLKIPALKGLFNSAGMLIGLAKSDSSKIKLQFEKLLEILNDNQWLSSASLACYAAYGLKEIVSAKYITMAIEYVMRYYGSDISNSITENPEILLAIPSLLIENIIDSRLENEILSSSPYSKTLSLFILSRESIDIERNNLAAKLIERCSDDINVKPEEFGPLNLSLFGCSLLNFGFEKVHLLNESEYFMIRRFFEAKTIPVSRGMEYIQEVIVLVVVLTCFYWEALLVGPPLLVLIQSLGNLAPEIVAWFLIAINGFIFYKFILPSLLPGIHDMGSQTLSRIRGKKSAGIR